MRTLSDDDVAGLLSLPDLLSAVETAFRKQGRGEVERPERPHFPVGEGLDGRAEPAGTGLTMPAYLHGADAYATKLASVHPDNPERGLATIHAQVVVTDAATGEPLALLAGERLTGARTGCIGGLAARDLAAGDGPVRVGVFGAGAQARWQTRAIHAARGTTDVRVFSPTPDSREACAADLRSEGADAAAVDSSAAAVDGADVVVTATTSGTPVFDGDALDPGTLVIAVGAYAAGARELDARTFERAARVFADVPEEVAEVGDVADNGVDPERLIPLSAVFEEEAGRADADEVLVVESVGSAVLDAAAAVHLYERAVEKGVGSAVDL